MQLSKRLLACSNFVAPGDRVADIGCDHGYLSIHLLKNKIASSVIASDIREGPLKSAMGNAEKYGITHNIRFFLSDGAASIPRDFDCMVCAGMGGDTMISILEGAPWLKSSQYRLVLQCQTRVHLLRQYLSDHGWRIHEETVVRDGHFLYSVMEVVWQPDYPRLTLGEAYFPPAMLENPSGDTAEYYQRLLFKLRRAIHGRGEQAEPKMVAALQELEAMAKQEELHWLKERTTWQP